MRLLTHTVTPQEAGLPVRTLLRRQLRISGSFLAKLKWRPGAITLNGVPVIVSARRGGRRAGGGRLRPAGRKPPHPPRGLSAGYSVGGRGPSPAE